MIDPIANVVDIWDECLRDVGNQCVHFPGIHDIDWLSAENTDITPWHYSKMVCHPNRIRYYSRSWYLLVLLFDAHDEKEGY